MAETKTIVEAGCKPCSKCAAVKSVEEFYREKGRRSASCISCTKVARKRYHERKKVERAGRASIPARSVCMRCHETKPGTEFHRDVVSSRGIKPYCRPCMASVAREYNYGITDSRFRSLFESQGASCAICRETLTAETLNVDHCHASQEVRGILCNSCNRGLGSFRDNRAYLLAAIDYLSDPPGRKIE